jgi:crotonobetainyl-CoA:carnitine CoA-transferase CaiB-like acyl-CoA transferase
MPAPPQATPSGPDASRPGTLPGASILSGLRVIDCGTYIAGPAAATILSDFGAEVIKIERPPYGDPYRYLPQVAGMPLSDVNYTWILDARNKKSVALDLCDAQARAALTKLIASADIFITNYQPQLQRKFALEYKDLAPLNPRLIYASVTGYGEHGDDAEKPGYDATAYWARSGLMNSMHNGDAEPVQSPAGFGDHPTSVTLFASIMLALYQRQITGRGAKVRTSLMANGVWSHSCAIQAALCGAQFLPKWTRKQAINPLVNHYVASDGRRIFLCLLDAAQDWPNLCAALDWPQHILADLRFNTAAARRANNVELIALLDEAIAKHDLAYWTRALKEHDLVWGPVPSPMEVATDPQLEANGVFAEVEPGLHQGLNHAGAQAPPVRTRTTRLKTVQNPINVEGIEKCAPRMAPEVGQDTREVLRSAGYSDDEIGAMIARGAALAR